MDNRIRTDLDPSQYDVVLGIYNKSKFLSDLDAAMEFAISKRQPLSMAFLDLDKFKSINDSHGHPVGDEVLRESAQLLLSGLSHHGDIYRYGGDEFSAILQNHTAEEAALLFERVRTSFENFRVSSKKLTISFSIGIAEVPRLAADVAELIRHTDEAMYKSKKLGRNLVKIYGEPDVPETKRTVTKKQGSDPSVLTDEEQDKIRLGYFRLGAAVCPRDGASLRIMETQMWATGPSDLLVECGYYGLDFHIFGER